MADIKVEKKSPMWPWILIGLLILAAVFYFLFANDANEDPDRTSGTELSDRLVTMQREAFPTLKNQAGAVRNSATAINPEVLALEQRDAIKSFYDSTAVLPQQINSSTN